MQQLHEFVCSRFALAECPLWQEGQVPTGTAFPYATFSLEPALAFGEPGLLTLTVWTKSEASHADRLALADAFLALVPKNGLVLRLDGGLGQLFPGHAPGRTLSQGDARGLTVPFDLYLYLTQ